MKPFEEFLEECRKEVPEVFPWDLTERFESGEQPFLVDVREPYEFNAMHMKGSLGVPRGVL